MYLTQMLLDQKNRQTLAALASPSKFHGAIEAAFPGPRQRNLWRIDSRAGQKYLLLLSETPPDLTQAAAQFAPPGEHWQTKSYDPLLSRILPGSRWQFRLAANPTKSCKDAQKPAARGTVAAHCTTQYQKQWLLDRAAKHGFALTEDSFTVTRVQWHHFAKRGTRPVSLLAVTYEGVLQVTDPEAFRNLLCQGMGRGKAYGLGLLTVMRGG